ncbi:D-xylose ABC transporter ATP-binding protein [Sporanaerobium hydrogeniformans]|uniref:D-xylose ABC transporter ATP-binding protein n=1 Tax=Sporanaerobium hydrogeniformans TaxID=3072179 RepID=A0AC61D8B4_9FIRM|nr:sugar ABC transporter ATP-binding protein [Sporanaerobium hydrogeniformans]PHV69661.1 D-xylose ABC transporter ATP-binding protein [Sporanaerobium hydrogeniformans]
MSDTVLKAEGITKKFCGITALDNASLEVKKGEVHALVGANGAGKSTLIKIITGAYGNDEGKIYLDGKEIHIKSTFEARKLGISAVYQEFSLINTVSVAENIYMGKFPCKKMAGVPKIDWKDINSKAQEILDLLESDIKPETIVGDLSVAQKQLVEIAKALSNEIKVLIMDEPTASLSDNDIEKMFNIVRGLKEKGISVIYVSHRLEELPIICDRISVYRDGKYIKTLPIEEAPKNVIIENMVGKNMTLTKRVNYTQPEALLEVKNFSSGKKFENINMKLHKGEILGIAGLAGAGRTEFVRALFGADPKDKGEILVEGKQVKIDSPLDAKRAGIGFITEDRKEEGLILNMSLHNNVGMTILNKLVKKFGLDLHKEEELMDGYIKSLSIKCKDGNQAAKDLSGGNQQKVVIAKWLATTPKILIMDEPTRGIDIGSKNQIYKLINELAEQGIGIIMISSELPEVLQVANRIVVFAAGKVTAELENKDLTQEILLDYATSQKAI